MLKGPICKIAVLRKTILKVLLVFIKFVTFENKIMSEM